MRYWFLTILDRIFAVIGALLFSQVPQLFHQYLLILSGHVSELNHQVHLMEQTALLTKKNLPEFIDKFLASSDFDFMAQGKAMKTILDRWQGLTEALQGLSQASPLTRPFVFIKHFNWQLSMETLQQFQFGVSFTIEAILYGCLGVLAGFIFFRFITLFFRFLNPMTYRKKHL